jgi:hypothetical protein
MEIDTKRFPKWSQNQCRNSLKNNAKICTETDEEDHGKTCFSEV